MRIRAFVASVLTFAVCLVPLRAEGPSTTQPSRTVGSVYGKPVTAADVGLTVPIDPAIRFDARDQAEWELMGRIQTTFGQPVMDRFVARRKIDATADEINAFRRNSRKTSEEALRETEGQLAKVKAELTSPDLPEKTRARLEKERTTLGRLLLARRDAAKDDTPEAIARMLITTWKIERELHRTYGGRVIFQQFGPEALDARRLLLEEAEKKGDLKFDDAGVRHLFYYYANMKHVVVDEKTLERPWFFGDGG